MRSASRMRRYSVCPVVSDSNFRLAQVQRIEKMRKRIRRRFKKVIKTIIKFISCTGCSTKVTPIGIDEDQTVVDPRHSKMKVIIHYKIY